ncbi:MAG: aminotransferase class IV family protein [Phycisphaerae bacterium]|nr:aminotransferase class IV family protein [Phycisphaerae bacterium]
MSERFVHLNGRLVRAGEARISAGDAGLLHGASTFTTMRAHNGVVFRLDRHIRRLLDTADFLGFQTGADPATLTAATGAVLEANALREARVRVTLTPGPVGSWREDNAPSSKPTGTALITAEDLGTLPHWWYEEGLTVAVASFKQRRGDPTAGVKTGCYLPRILARQEAGAKGAAEALWFTTDNRLAEACFCNVFLVAGETVRTPPRDTPVLPGVVREAVGEICRHRGIEYDDNTSLTVEDMLAAEEMFLTSSVSGLRPVVRVEQHVVGDGKPGQMTRIIASAYGALLDGECATPEGGATT